MTGPSVEQKVEPDGPVLEVVNPGVCGWCDGPLVELCPDGNRLGAGPGPCRELLRDLSPEAVSD